MKKHELIFEDITFLENKGIDVRLLEKTINRFIPKIVKDDYMKLYIRFITNRNEKCQNKLERRFKGTFNVRKDDDNKITSNIDIYIHRILKLIKKDKDLDITCLVIEILLHELGHYVSISDEFINRKNKKLNAFDFYEQFHNAELEVRNDLYKKSKKEYEKWNKNNSEEKKADRFFEEKIDLFVDILCNNEITSKKFNK